MTWDRNPLPASCRTLTTRTRPAGLPVAVRRPPGDRRRRIVGLWIAGIADKPFEGDSGFLCWLIVGIAALGILCVFLQRWRDVEWLATHVVRIGLLGTVVGLIVAFSAAKAGGSADPNEIRPMIAAVVDGMYVSLYATLLGIATNLWLKINLRLLGNVDG